MNITAQVETQPFFKKKKKIKKKKKDNARVVTYIGYHCSRQEKSFSRAHVAFSRLGRRGSLP